MRIGESSGVVERVVGDIGSDDASNFKRRNIGSTFRSASENGKGNFQRNLKNNNNNNQEEEPNQGISRWISDIFDPKEASIFVPVITVRIFSLVVWTLSIFYATYHVYIACEAHLQEWYKDPVMNPSRLSGLFKRGKDATDYEWEMFTTVIIKSLWLWYSLHAVLCRIVQPVLQNDEWKYLSIGVCICMFYNLLGFLPIVCMVAQPAMYWLIAKTRSKTLTWILTVFFIMNLNSPLIYTFIPKDRFSEYFFVISSAWNFARCISFCYDVWETTDSNSVIGFSHLVNLLQFCFYTPLAISGPLITYDSFEQNIIKKDLAAMKERNLSEDVTTLFKKLGKIALIALLNEFILHFLYFRALSMTPNVHKKLSLWAVCGTIYWLGQFFAMKYKVLYGIPTAIAEFDGMPMPSLPTCPSHMHRYSALWREFDAGLYRFLVRYIYVPALKCIKEVDDVGMIPEDLQKLMASFVTYLYVYMWHSLSFEVFIWTALNFLGITIERIGSVIKRKVDKKTHVDQIYWDFVVEPIVTLPLAAMSILNSSIFCGSLDAAASFGGILWRRRSESWVFLFLYFFTHTAVAHRTWRHKLSRLFWKIKTA